MGDIYRPGILEFIALADGSTRPLCFDTRNFAQTPFGWIVLNFAWYFVPVLFTERSSECWAYTYGMSLTVIFLLGLNSENQGK